MNQLVIKGFNAYKIFLKNKLATSIMMLVSGVMMLIAAINGHGNDTKTLPSLITVVGVVLAFWSFYRIGYLKSSYDKQTDRVKKTIERQAFFSQILETLMYVAVAGLGFFLILNEGFTNKVLNLMSGGFTTLNGVLGVIGLYKSREDEMDFRRKLRIGLTIVELILGPLFIFMSDSIGVGWYVVMGALTTVAGLIEVVTALTHENIDSTIEDGKKIVSMIKDGENGSE